MALQFITTTAYTVLAENFLGYADYTPVNEMFMVATTTTKLCVTLQTLDDNFVEFEEDLEMHISNNSPAIVLVEPIIAMITIVNTDGELYQLSLFELDKNAAYSRK